MPKWKEHLLREKYIREKAELVSGKYGEDGADQSEIGELNEGWLLIAKEVVRLVWRWYDLNVTSAF